MPLETKSGLALVSSMSINVMHNLNLLNKALFPSKYIIFASKGLQIFYWATTQISDHVLSGFTLICLSALDLWLSLVSSNKNLLLSRWLLPNYFYQVIHMRDVTHIAKNAEYKITKFSCCVRANYFWIVSEMQCKGRLSWDGRRLLEYVVSRCCFRIILEEPVLSATQQQSVKGGYAKLKAFLGRNKDKKQVSYRYNAPNVLCGILDQCKKR